MNAEMPALQVGDWIDVVDDDGIWNVAQVLKVPTEDTIEVTYDCWGDDYNEVIRRDSNRIAPFHTHTWAVKCWAKLGTWPWWPALLTVRAPGSTRGIQNLRIEQRLLVDFLDRPKFTERSRCWVKQSNLLALHSNRIKSIQSKRERKGELTETRSKNLAFAMALLAKCDASEDFPVFLEGTLPMQFQYNVTKSREQLRKEMGEEVWMHAFVNNRVNHAATHAYPLAIDPNSESNKANSVKLVKPVEKTDGSTTRSHDISQKKSDNGCLLDAETVNKVSTTTETIDTPVNLVTNQAMTQVPKNAVLRKRTRSNAEHDTLDSIVSRTGMVTSSCRPTQENRSKQCQSSKNVGDEFQEVNIVEDELQRSVATTELCIEPRRYGKTPKKLRKTRRSALKLPPYIPHYARFLPKPKAPDEEHTAPPSQICHDTQSAQPRVQKELPASDQNAKPSNASMKSVSLCEVKDGNNMKNPMKSLTLSTQATLQAVEKLRNMEAAMDNKLSELTDKTIQVDELRDKCAGLPRYTGEGSQVRSLASDDASKTQDVIQDNLQLGSSCYDSMGVSGVPAFASRSTQFKNAIRELELALDDVVWKQQGQKNLSAATTPAELNAIKAELLRSSKLQAVTTRMERLGYGSAAFTDIPYGRDSLLLHDNYGCTLEEVKPQCSTYLSVTEQSARKPSQPPSSQHFSRLWGYDRDSEASCERLHSLSSCSVLSCPPPAGHSFFGFSVNDNFTISQWYRDLYPKSFGFQQSS